MAKSVPTVGHHGGVSKNATDAVVVGSGPNGLAAAIELARAGRSVVVYEAEDTIGGGCRSAELTLPGFVHDTCSAIHSVALVSPFIRSLPLADLGVDFVHPQVPLAHPLDGGDAAVLARSVAETAAALGPDEAAYRRLMEPLVTNSANLAAEILGPIRLPRHPLALARFAPSGLRSASGLARSKFKDRRAQALLGGLGAHSILRLDQAITAGVGLVLGTFAHAVGWPAVRGGSQVLADAMAAYLRSLGGEIVTGTRIDSLTQLPRSGLIFLDVTPRQLVAIAGDRMPAGYLRRIGRYRYGPGAFKLDWALDGPIPWSAEACRRAGTVHVAGTLEEVELSEETVAKGGHPDKPFVLLVQQSVFDDTRAPAGKQTVWAYCHVPNGSTIAMTDQIEAQVERFAPGFRDLILARHITSPADMEKHNANYVGGDINGGTQDIRQFFTRPIAKIVPYSVPLADPPPGCKGLYLCSSSTPPGGAVHGMCGYFAATAALRALRRQGV